MSGDGFFRGHQVARVLGVAIPLVMFLLWWSWQGNADVVSETEVSAVVLSVDGRTCLVRIESGEHVRILKPRDVREGMTLTMRRTLFEDGELRFQPMATRAAVGAE